MTSDSIDEIRKQTAYPESKSVHDALHQVWNEVAHEFNHKMKTGDNYVDVDKLRKELPKDCSIIEVDDLKKSAMVARDYDRELEHLNDGIIKEQKCLDEILKLHDKYNQLDITNEIGKIYLRLHKLKKRSDEVVDDWKSSSKL